MFDRTPAEINIIKESPKHLPLKKSALDLAIQRKQIVLL
jgi:hypothetical protein